MNRIEAIERLARLKETGAITDEEYEVQKRVLLADRAPGPRAGLIAVGGLACLVAAGLGWFAYGRMNEPGPVAAAPATAPIASAQAGVASAAGIGPPSAQPAAAAAPAAPEAGPDKPASAPVPASGLTAERLVGLWGNAEAGCSDDGNVELQSDGRYRSGTGGGGRWRLEGSSLHMTNWGGAPARIALRPGGELAVTWSYGSEVWQRC